MSFSTVLRAAAKFAKEYWEEYGKVKNVITALQTVFFTHCFLKFLTGLIVAGVLGMACTAIVASIAALSGGAAFVLKWGCLIVVDWAVDRVYG